MFNKRDKNFKEKKQLTFTQQIFAPIVTLKDLISTSFSISSSSSSSTHNTKPEPAPVAPIPMTITPQSSCKSLLFDPPLSVSTPKSSLVHSYTSLSNYRLKSNFNNRQYSLEEQIHQEECLYCSSESALSIKTDSNNNYFDQNSIHSLNLLHAIEMYLSSNNSLNEQFDLSSMSSEQHTTITETKQLNLCEINEIIYAIHSTINDNNERNETLDSLASSLREIAEETPVVVASQDEGQIIAIENIPEPPPPGLGRILVRAVMYEIVLRLFSFYLLIFMCCAR
jgi:hypothetical protein